MMKITKFIFLILTLVISIDVVAKNEHKEANVDFDLQYPHADGYKKQSKNAIKTVNKEKKHLCYKNEYLFKDNPKYKDIVELNIILTGNKVTGEYNYIPAFKDQRFGNIEGTIDNNTIKAIYTFEQEGEEDSATISIKLNDKSAIVEGGDVSLGLSDNIAKTDCKY